MNDFFREGPVGEKKSFSSKEKEMIKKRLRALGHIE